MVTCPECRGTGRRGRCPTCAGNRVVREDVAIDYWADRDVDLTYSEELAQDAEVARWLN